MKGTVIKSTGSWYTVITEERKYIECRIKGKMRLKGLKSTNPIAVGDKVEYEFEPGKETAVISGVDERKNYIIRKATNLSKQTHIIAANIDRAFLIATLALPRTSTGFIDRFLVTAEAYQIPVTIIFNKKDIYEVEMKDELKELLSTYLDIGYDCLVVSAFNENDLEKIKTLMKNKTTLFSGHSGVGKSTLINKLEPTLDLKTGDISSVHFKGKHTTTFAEMFPLSEGGFIIDTPGIKEFGLVEMEKEELAKYFPEMRKIKSECKFNNCLHVNEPHCAVKKAVEAGTIAESRYINYLSILNSEELKGEFE